MAKKTISGSYLFLALMLLGIVLGCITGALWEGAAALEPLGTV
ncbi:MAG: dicarboxylate/amino acid:cation symporter, partial [Papillibacter sp.]|nr:dicarboxylate/amino acid:cation symporter [Papillibacter sp.]